MDFALAVWERWLILSILGLFASLFLFTFDIFLLFKGRDFGFVRTYFMVVDFKEPGGDIDGLHFVGSEINFPLKTLLNGNRFLLLRMLWAAHKLKPYHLVPEFGGQTHNIMELVRYQLAPLNRSGLVKDAANRFAPGSFKIVKLQMKVCIAFHSGVFKIWLVHKYDLENAQKYLKANTSRQRDNRKILYELARDYKESPDHFIPFTLFAG